MALELLEEKALVVAMVCRGCDSHGTWWEGCPCHEHMLSGCRPLIERVLNCRRASMKGPRNGV